jgi:allantoin racemase
MNRPYLSGSTLPSVLILNPNSSAPVTEAIADVVAAFGDIPLNIQVEQIDQGPEAIESSEDHAIVTPLILRKIQASPDIDAVVIACHGDPGVSAARELGGPRVLGLGELSMFAASSIGGKFGIITLSNGLIDRKRLQVSRYGLKDRCSGISASNTGIMHGLSDAPDIRPYVEAGADLIKSGATSVILGCAGMVRVQYAVQHELGVPVIEPVRTAIGVVLGLFGKSK